MHYSFILLLQLPYRPHLGEDKTCHLWVESGEMMGDFKEEEEVEVGRGGEEEEDGWKECLLSPPFHISLPLPPSFLVYLALFLLPRSRCLSL